MNWRLAGVQREMVSKGVLWQPRTERERPGVAGVVRRVEGAGQGAEQAKDKRGPGLEEGFAHKILTARRAG